MPSAPPARVRTDLEPRRHLRGSRIPKFWESPAASVPVPLPEEEEEEMKNPCGGKLAADGDEEDGEGDLEMLPMGRSGARRGLQPAN